MRVKEEYKQQENFKQIANSIIDTHGIKSWGELDWQGKLQGPGL